MSRHSAQILNEVTGVPNDKIDLIPHGVPDLPFVEPHGFQTKKRRSPNPTSRAGAKCLQKDLESINWAETTDRSSLGTGIRVVSLRRDGSP